MSNYIIIGTRVCDTVLGSEEKTIYHFPKRYTSTRSSGRNGLTPKSDYKEGHHGM